MGRIYISWERYGIIEHTEKIWNFAKYISISYHLTMGAGHVGLMWESLCYINSYVAHIFPVPLSISFPYLCHIWPISSCLVRGKHIIRTFGLQRWKHESDFTSPALPLDKTTHVLPNCYIVEQLVAKRVRSGKTKLFIKWLGWHAETNTWEPSVLPTSIRPCWKMQGRGSN